MRPSAQAEIAIALAHCRKPELASLAEILKSVAASFRGIRAAAIEAFRKTLKRGHGILEPVLDNQPDGVFGAIAIRDRLPDGAERVEGPRDAGD